jgi:uncharacterized protein YcbX
MSSALFDVPLVAVATELFVYPVKACAGVAVDALELGPRGGPVGDRGWAVVDADGIVTWQGSHPRLALVAPRFATAAGDAVPRAPAEAAGTRLLLDAPGLEPILTPPDAQLSSRTVRIFNEGSGRHDTFEAADAGDLVARWLERAAGAPLRLVRLGAAARERDGMNALHLVCTASVAAVDAQLAAAGAPPADPRRYRPNVVLAGQGDSLDPFIEDNVESLTWRHGGAQTRLAVTSLCIRCIVPNVDPATGTIADATGLALASLSQRRRPSEAVAFGLYARGEPGARLARGDTATLALAF